MSEMQAWIMFGDGLQAYYYDEKNPRPNREGVKVQPILIVPSQELRDAYDLTDDDLNIETDDGPRGIWMEYPVKQILWLRKSRRGSVVLIMCAFNSSSTTLMSYYNELLEWDQQRDIKEARWKLYADALSQELEALTSNRAEYFRKIKELQDMLEPKQQDDDMGD